MPAFAKSVFVNCPFDPEYRLFYDSMVFAILYLGFDARTSYEESDAGEPRIEKLVRLIAASKFGIHDLSRCRAKKVGEYYRLNMPLELGIDLGCRRFGSPRQKRKRVLVLDVHRYRFQKAVSDMAGCDIKSYGRTVRKIVRAVSTWLVQSANVPERSVSEISTMHVRFKEDNFDRLQAHGHSVGDINQRSHEAMRRDMKRWVAENRPNRAGDY